MRWLRALTFLALMACAWPAAEPATARLAPPFTHEGRFITDARGRVVFLHGWNMVHKLPPYLPSAVGFGENDARFLAREGFNTVRLGVIWKGLEPQPGRIDEGYLRDLLRTTRLLARHRIAVLLDFHQDMYNERFSGEGMPDWAVDDDGLPNEPDAGFPGNYVAMPALWRAFDHFWANDPAEDARPLQDAFAAAWTRVARRFRKEPLLLGYNILNEPFPGSQWPSCASSRGCPAFDLLVLTPFTKRVLAAIRSVDRRSLVWYAPHLFFDFGTATYHGDTGDEAAGFAFNDYCLPGDPAPDGEPEEEGCRALEQRVFDNAEQHSAATGDALLLTEFAATDNIPTIERMTDLADDNMVSWQQWAYWNEDPSRPALDDRLVIDPRKPPRGDNLKRDKLAASVRAYPQAVAGTPVKFDFERDSGAFTLVYSTARAGGGRPLPRCTTTEIVTPEHVYPHGYRVEAAGAKVISRPHARVLRVVATRRTKEVIVKVTRGEPGATRWRGCARR